MFDVVGLVNLVVVVVVLFYYLKGWTQHKQISMRYMHILRLDYMCFSDDAL